MSLFPLGLLSQGGGAGGAAFELISTAYGTGSSGTITFSSLPSTYKHLQIRMTTRTDRAGAVADFAMLRLNGSSASSYSTHYLRGDGYTISSASNTGVNYIHVGETAGGNASAGVYNASIIDILDFANANKVATVRCSTGVSDPSVTNQWVYLSSGALQVGASAVTSLTIFGYYSSNFTTATRVSLYGIRG